MATDNLIQSIATFMYTICSILSTFMLLHLYYSIMTAKKKKHSLLYYGLYIVCVIASTLGLYNGTLRCYLSYSHSIDSNALLQNIYMDVCDDLFYFVSSYLFYVLVLFKVQNIFANTLYSVQQRTSYTIYASVALCVCVSIWRMATYFKDQGDVIHHILLFCTLLFNLTLNIFVIALFISKLAVIISSHNHDGNCQTIIDRMIKHVFLFGIAISWNQIFHVVMLIHQFEPYPAWFVLFSRGVDQMTNIIALYLCFKFNQRIYHKICFCVHRMNSKCCVKSSFDHADKNAQNASHKISKERTNTNTTSDEPSFDAIQTAYNKYHRGDNTSTDDELF
eukprot:391845_1